MRHPTRKIFGVCAIALCTFLLGTLGCSGDDARDQDGAVGPDADAADNAGADSRGDRDAGAAGICGAQAGQLFGGDHPWNQRIDSAALDEESDKIINYLQNHHTASDRFRIDGPSETPNSLYGITILHADEKAEHREFETRPSEFYTPDCDTAPVPLPAGGAIEGSASYACPGDNGDCHLIVIDTAECRLYEMWRANVEDTSFLGGCMAVWDLRQQYAPALRGECCTSADAAGLPIAAHMFTADEIAAGDIKHAIRFILPNAHIRERVYVRPATHSTPATSGPADAPPYGARLRLAAGADLSALNPAAQVVARALQRYGMILADGGNLTFTAANDRFTTRKWADVGLEPGDLTRLSWSDFEVVELGQRYVFDTSCDCKRQAVSQ